MVRPGQVVFVDGGTTAVQLARHLPRELEATVVTHSPSVAVELVEHPGVAVELIGGRLFKHSVVAVGAAAIEAIARIRADTYFMGVTGVHPEVGLTTGDPEEAAVKRDALPLRRRDRGPRLAREAGRRLALRRRAAQRGRRRSSSSRPPPTRSPTPTARRGLTVVLAAGPG